MVYLRYVDSDNDDSACIPDNFTCRGISKFGRGKKYSSLVL